MPTLVLPPDATDLRITRGDDVTVVITVYTDATQTVVLNLTGYTVAVQIVSLGVAPVTLAPTATIPTPLTGQFQFPLTAAQTTDAAQTPDPMFYACTATKAGKAQITTAGKIRFVPAT